jgi:hypothetical protein
VIFGIVSECVVFGGRQDSLAGDDIANKSDSRKIGMEGQQVESGLVPYDFRRFFLVNLVSLRLLLIPLFQFFNKTTSKSILD